MICSGQVSYRDDHAGFVNYSGTANTIAAWANMYRKDVCEKLLTSSYFRLIVPALQSRFSCWRALSLAGLTSGKHHW